MFKKTRRLLLIGLIALAVFKGRAPRVEVFKNPDTSIILDAGHGGSDPGTIGFSGNYEKDINLQITIKLKEKLTAKGYKVVLTRDSDEYVDNIERAQLANKERGNLFISIHGNALENNSSTSGIQVLYYPSGESVEGEMGNHELAQMMMDSLIGKTAAVNMGIIERKDLIVLSQTQMPSMVIECGFLSNENEEKLLLTDNYQDKIVDGIIEGLEKYIKQKASQAI